VEGGEIGFEITDIVSLSFLIGVVGKAFVALADVGSDGRVASCGSASPMFSELMTPVSGVSVDLIGLGTSTEPLGMSDAGFEIVL
jgi:hypothetical protein